MMYTYTFSNQNLRYPGAEVIQVKRLFCSILKKKQKFLVFIYSLIYVFCTTLHSILSLIGFLKKSQPCKHLLISFLSLTFFEVTGKCHIARCTEFIRKKYSIFNTSETTFIYIWNYYFIYIYEIGGITWIPHISAHSIMQYPPLRGLLDKIPLQPPILPIELTK